MEIYSKVYDRYADAESTVRELQEVGIPDSDISLVANSNEYDIDRAIELDHDDDGVTATASGVGIGAVAGGGIGLLAGLGLIAIPGLGPVVAGGWLAATAVGAIAGSAAGGLVGALIDAGISEDDANVYTEAVRRGGALVTVRTSLPADDVEAILGRHQPVDVAERRREYEDAGWEQPDPADAAHPYNRPGGENRPRT